MLQDTLRELIDPVIEAEKMELVDIDCLKMKNRWLIRLFIDKENGVTLGDCERISHLVGDILDIHETPPGPYVLEVSSPGLDRPLTRDKDFFRFKGEYIGVRTIEKIEGSRNFHGRLVDYVAEENGNSVILDMEGKIVKIFRRDIAKAHLETERAQTPGPLSGKRAHKKKA